MNKPLIIFLLLVIILGAGFYTSLNFFGIMGTDHYSSIEEAKKAGVYNCCYEPGCHMCYNNANKWNHQQSGTCDCADLIAQGKTPCPECVEALKGEKTTCDVEQGCE